MSALTRDPPVSADHQPNCCHAQLCASRVDFSFLAGVAANFRLRISGALLATRRRTRSDRTERAHQVQPTIIFSMLPQIDPLPTRPGGALRTAVWASFPPDGVIHKTTLRANRSNSSKSCASGTHTFVLSYVDVEACIEAT